MSRQEPFPTTPAAQLETSAVAPQPAAAKNLRPGAIELPMLLALTAGALVYAWLRRTSGDLTAETGPGYLLGIVGGTMMVVLLAYPLRKRLRALRPLGGIRGWFRLHMILGILGPAAIVLHSNFTLGSLNSTAAMMSMLVVAGSGLIGRFLYSRIHRGLYGKRESLRERMAAVGSVQDHWSAELGTDLVESLNAYQAQRLDGVNTFWGSFLNTLSGPVSRARLRRKVMREVDQARRVAQAGTYSGAFGPALDAYLMALGRAEAFRFYERSFAAWHLFHLPLFFILVAAAIVHVVAVHLY